MVKKRLKKIKRNLKSIRLRFAKRIILGASFTQYAGWISTEINDLDITSRENFARYWQPNSCQSFLAEHVWEHLSEEEARIANENCFYFLKPGGHLRIAVPDGFHPDQKYINAVRPGGNGPGAMDHKVLYTYKVLAKSLSDVGFEVSLLEYWDENTQFHFQEWNSTNGHIERSKRFDPRNQNGNLIYTSLIVDAVKL